MSLTALSPLDGRYSSKVQPLSAYFSEYALNAYRLYVEIEFFIALSEEPKIREFPRLSAKNQQMLRSIVDKFSAKEAASVKKIESKTNHDVKAIEYYLKQKLSRTPLKKYSEFVHFACTSEDINNLAYALMIRDALKDEYLPALTQLEREIRKLAKRWKSVPLLAKTHGQPASPTTVGKEFLVFSHRLDRQVQALKRQEILAKINGATGNYNAHASAYPDVNWIAFSRRFLKKLKLTPNLITTQIEQHDYMAEIFHTISRINTIVLDFDRDMWLYISHNVFKQKSVKGEVGSSTMPHKVNPIDFENSEGNIGLANALLGHMAEKLMVSRLQRDLSDSTVQRNIGTAFGYGLLAYRSTLRGISKLELNRAHIKEELDQNWTVLAEAIQTVMRKHRIEKPYEKLKALTRGKKITSELMQNFIQGLKIPQADKKRLLAMTPANYLGQVDRLFKIAL